MKLSLLEDRLAICQLPADAALPGWLNTAAGFFAVTRTREELSLVCREEVVPAGARQERGWRAFKVAGPLDFALTGVLASLAAPLAQAGISIFAVSTYHTDYVLVRADNIPAATAALRAAGHEVDAD